MSATHPGLFTGVPFIMGSIRGERCWTLGTDGMLNSPQYAYNWGPGVNLAYCGTVNRPRAHGHQRPPSMMEFLYAQPADRVIKAVKSFLPEDARSVSISIEGYRGVGYGSIPLWTPEENLEVTITFETEKDQVVVTTPKLSDKVKWWKRPFPKITTEPVTVKRWCSSTREVTLGQVVHAVKAIPHMTEDCSCGFYAYLNGKNDYEQAGRVVGIVEGFGQTFMGTRGFRAQKARILALTVTASSVATPFTFGGRLVPIIDVTEAQDKLDAVLPRLRARYPDMVIFNTKEEMLAEFSPTTEEEIEEYREPLAEESDPV